MDLKENIYNMIKNCNSSLNNKEISKNEELRMIKSSKLSFYNDRNADDKKREEYIKLYGKVNSDFKNDFANAKTEEARKQILDSAIRDSINIRNLFLESNFHLIVNCVNKYKEQVIDNAAITEEDLFYEGFLGLINALRRYNFKSKIAFSTFSTFEIKRFIKMAIDSQSRTIKVSSHMLEKVSKLHEVEKELTITLNRKPTNLELAHKMNISIEEVNEIKNVILETASLNEKIDDDYEIGDFVIDDKEDFAEQVCESIINGEVVNTILNSGLTEKEIDILFSHFGIYGDSVTYDQLGLKYGLTSERIRQIEKAALNKLKINSKVRKLNDNESVSKR